MSDIYAPQLEWNERAKCYIGYAKNYPLVLNYFQESEIEYKDDVLNLVPFPKVKEVESLRDYQRKAIEAWSKKGRGIVVLPTGAGKTMVGLAAISKTKISTLIVVPTVDLLYQWAKSVENVLGTNPE